MVGSLRHEIVLWIYVEQLSVQFDTQTMEDNISIIAYFTFMAFMASFVFSAMGIGSAVIFLFIHQIGSLFGLFADCCGLKYAVFIQGLMLAVIQPFVLMSSGLKVNLRFDLLVPFILIQFVGTPIGQFLQDYTPGSILKMIIGILTIIVAGKQIHNICGMKKVGNCKRNYIINAFTRSDILHSGPKRIQGS